MICVLQLKKACENGDAAILRSCLKTNPGLDIDALEDEVCVGERWREGGGERCHWVVFFVGRDIEESTRGKE